MPRAVSPNAVLDLKLNSRSTGIQNISLNDTILLTYRYQPAALILLISVFSPSRLLRAAVNLYVRSFQTPLL
jgi:hypothetical protein